MMPISWQHSHKTPVLSAFLTSDNQAKPYWN